MWRCKYGKPTNSALPSCLDKAAGARCAAAHLPCCGCSAAQVCDGAAPMFRNQPIAVIGGGDSGEHSLCCVLQCCVLQMLCTAMLTAFGVRLASLLPAQLATRDPAALPDPPARTALPSAAATVIEVPAPHINQLLLSTNCSDGGGSLPYQVRQPQRCQPPPH